MEDTEELKTNIINVLVPINKVLGLDVIRKNLPCPNKKAHKNNDRHSSAHIYENHVHCFTCRRRYYVSDICYFKNIDKNNLYEKLKSHYGDKLFEEYEKNSTYEEKKVKIEVKKENKSFIDYTKEFFKNC